MQRLIEHLHVNGTEHVATQHDIDSALRSDRSLHDVREARRHGKEPITVFPYTELQSDPLIDFVNSPAFKKLKKNLLASLDEMYIRQERKELFEDFAGAAFEQVAFNHFQDAYQDRGTILSPSETDSYFLDRHKGYHVNHFPFGRIGIDGVRVPDSLIMDRGAIVAQVEFSLSQDEEYYHKKVEGFLENRSSVHFEERSYDNAQLIFVAPNDLSENMRRNFSEIYGDDLDFSLLPFPRGEFIDTVLEPISYVLTR